MFRTVNARLPGQIELTLIPGCLLVQVLNYTEHMLRQIRKYRQVTTRAVVMLFLISGSLSTWASVTAEAKRSVAPKHQSMHQDGASATHSQMQHQSDSNSQQDCCKQSENCNNLCCNFCMVGGVAGLALLPIHQLHIDYHPTRFFQSAVSLPDGVMSSTLYRPPQSLLI